LTVYTKSSQSDLYSIAKEFYYKKALSVNWWEQIFVDLNTFEKDTVFVNIKMNILLIVMLI